MEKIFCADCEGKAVMLGVERSRRFLECPSRRRKERASSGRTRFGKTNPVRPEEARSLRRLEGHSRKSRSNPFFIILFLFFCSSTFALEPVYHFSNNQDTKRFQYWTETVRCVVCQGQNLSESSAPIALDLKQKIAELIRRQKSDEDIKQYLVTRYGESILYWPIFSYHSVVLWLIPCMMLLGVLYWMFRRTS